MRTRDFKNPSPSDHGRSVRWFLPSRSDLPKLLDIVLAHLWRQYWLLGVDFQCDRDAGLQLGRDGRTWWELRGLACHRANVILWSVGAIQVNSDAAVGMFISIFIL